MNGPTNGTLQVMRGPDGSSVLSIRDHDTGGTADITIPRDNAIGVAGQLLTNAGVEVWSRPPKADTGGTSK